MTAPLTIGIAIPFYSRLDYLAEALHSLQAQDDRDWIAVVVDDESPEHGAAELVAALGDERIRYVRNEVNLGLSGNFNRCLIEPGTDVVAIFHADDRLEPGYVSAIRAAHLTHPDAACVAPMARAIDAEGRPIDTAVDKMKRRLWPKPPTALVHGDRGLARLMHGFFVYCPAMSYRPALLPQPRFDPRWKQVMDVDLFARILFAGGSFALHREPVYQYRRHAGTVTAGNAGSFTRLAEESAIDRMIARTAKEMGWRRTWFAARLRWSIRLNGLVAVAGAVRRRRPGAARALRDVFGP